MILFVGKINLGISQFTKLKSFTYNRDVNHDTTRTSITYIIILWELNFLSETLFFIKEKLIKKKQNITLHLYNNTTRLLVPG